MRFTIRTAALLLACYVPCSVYAQQRDEVRVEKISNENRVDIYVGKTLFTQFIYPDSLEKPVLYPIYDAAGTRITRGFPMDPKPGDPTDHPHHLGLWFTYENVNGLDFWNNSFAIPVEKKSQYGWIRTDKLLEISSGSTGKLSYHANWVNQKKQVLLEETTLFEFSGIGEDRFIDRVTELKADTDILFTDAKDGLIGLRMAHELQIPSLTDQKFTDNKGNVTIVQKDTVANGNYLTSENKRGDSAWSTRAEWCMAYGKIGADSVSIIIFDHIGNPGYPTFWHARGYGLFAANPLGKNIFTQGKSSLNLTLKKGETIRFCYRILIVSGKKIPDVKRINQIAKEFSQKF